MQSLISVEPDFNWWTKIKQSAPPSVDLRYCGDLLEYVGFIDACEDESLDFALVDGKRRDECILAAIPKLKPGALLVLDNANWFFPSRKTYSPPSPTKQEGRWDEVFRAVEDWRCVWTSCGVTDTALFFKPVAPST